MTQPEDFLLHAPQIDLFIPDGKPIGKACANTSHLCIAAHQDDVEIMAFHGIAECYKKSGQGFGAVIVTDGAGSPRAGAFAHYSDSQMKLVRKAEQRKAAALGKYTFACQLGYPSTVARDARNQSIRQDLTTILAACRPEVLYLHNLADKHPTHVALVLKCLAAVRELPIEQRPQKVYGCEIWRDLDWLPDGLKVALRTDQQPELAQKLLAVFESQIAGGKRYDLATIGRRQANATFSEPHQTDQAAALSWAMDLTPLITNDQLEPADFIKPYLDAFTKSVIAALRS